MNKEKHSKNTFALFTNSIGYALSLIEDNKIDECKKLLQKMKIYSLGLSQIESLNNCLNIDDN